MATRSTRLARWSARRPTRKARRMRFAPRPIGRSGTLTTSALSEATTARPGRSTTSAKSQATPTMPPSEPIRLYGAAFASIQTARWWIPAGSRGARGINDAGQVVGLARVPADACGSASHAFRTEPNATIISSPFPPFADGLGTLVSPPYSNCRSSISFAINSAGVSVGESATEVTTGWSNQAFRTAPLVYRIDLNEFGWGNSTPYAINDLG